MLRTSESDADRQGECLSPYYAAAGKMAQAAQEPETDQLVLEETSCVALSKVGNER